ncbi:response regulator transcription factor [Anaerosphaera multitolerans]|uniref:DNA-binding response regulator n=1 Tax=Anaerosphaera multitolerans TaxID=2487351 RepID=A0A437S644_9FIRM|nr:response regulator transcription factor [Anaerosphaera multitolerans]RVU54376.1 DNA-binding response regulator [Anaerosphaera multitolerans]
MDKILIIEDDVNLAENLYKKLEENNYKAHILKDIENFKKEFYNFMPNLILLDINLGSYNGFELCMNLRKQTKIPILFITGRDSEKSEIEALNIGGDDYIKKPFSMDILLARIDRQLKSQSMENRKSIIYKELELEIDKQIIKNLNSKEVLELSSIEFQLLFYLINKAGEVVDRGELMDYLWENRNYVDPNALNVSLSRLRKSLAEISDENFIESIRGEGIRFC